uniref:PA domain-containing protein n=1 Tax=Pseudonaja textilis TaxID=8673 RepID=A0A670ZM55_PSETE
MKYAANKHGFLHNFRKLSAKPHMATTKGDQDLVKLLLERWNDPECGLDKATEIQYDVFLSFPDPKKPNRVAVGEYGSGEDRAVIGKVLWGQCSLATFPLPGREDCLNSPFMGCHHGKLVYANQGRMSDYEFLLNQSIDLNGTIAITRYGGAGRVAKAINGAKFGVIGVVVYTDPADINDGKSSPEETYPHSWYMPRSGVERGSFKTGFGDLLTPYFPAKRKRRRKEGISGISTIPIQPIGFEDARELIWWVSNQTHRSPS